MMSGIIDISAQGVIPTKGKEFWVGFMENYEVEAFQEALNLFITSDQNTSGTVSIPMQGWSQNFTVTANQTTTVTIPNNLAEHYTNQIIENKGVYVSTADTVAVFAINFNGYTADGTKILPIKSIGTEYRIATYSGILGAYPSEFLIVATQDDTEVEITPSVATAGGNAAGVPFTVQLDAGQSYQVQSQVAEQDFTGTVIKGTEASGDCRPFAVFSGVSCTNIYPGCFACDHIFEENFPVETWGTEFYIVPFSFANSYTYRVLADEDGTVVDINGSTVNLNAGQFVEYNDISGVVCVNANKPICTIQYMEGLDCGGAGDPAMMILNDASQKIDNITFSTVTSNVINQHGMNMIVESAFVGQVTLDGVLIPAGNFTPFPSCPSHSYAQQVLTQGSHTLECPEGVTAYIYGTGGYESYAYSVGSFSPLPPLDIDSVLCTSDTVNLAMIGDFSNVYWYAQSDPETILGTGPQLTLYPPIVSDIYVAAGDQFVSGCTDEQYFAVEVPDPPVLSLTQSAEEVCQYQSVQLNVTVDPPSNIYTYDWQPNAGLNDPTIPDPIATPLQSTWYVVTVSTPTGCGSNTDSLYIEVTDGNITNFDAESSTYAYCLGGEAQFTTDIQEVIFSDDYDPGISWGLWANITNGAESNACGSVSGNALYFNGAGARSATTNDLNVSQGGNIQFAIKIGSGAFPCDNADPGEDVVLEYSTNGGGAWTAIQTLFEYAYTNFTELSIEIPVGAQTASTRFRWRQLANSGPNQDNWSLDNVYIGATDLNNFSFTWTPNYNITSTTVPDPIVFPEVSTTYYVEVYDAVYGCTYTDSIFIDVGQPFTLDITPDTSLCDVQGIELYAIPSVEDAEYEYVWAPNNGTISNVNSPNPTVSPAVTTTYEVYVNSSGGCIANGEVTINVNQLLDLDVITDNNNFCEGESAQLNALLAGNPQNLVYEWVPDLYLNDASIANPISTPEEPVTYTVTVTDALAGCVLSEDITITVYPAFDLVVTPDTSICTVQGFQLSAVASEPGPFDWQWTPAASLNNANIASPTITINATESFTVTATDGGGCSVTETVDVELLFESFDLGPDVNICEGELTTLATGYDATYTHDWSTGASTPTIEVGASNNYSVTVTSPEGCSETDAINVVVHALPTVNLGPDQSLCEGEQYVIDALNAGSDFEWSTGVSTQAILVDESGDYSVEVTDFWGCVNSDEITVTFHENPVINLPAITTICEDETVILDAGNPGSTYVWNSGQSTQSIEVNQEYLYEVTVTNIYGCTSEDQAVVEIETYPVVNLGPDRLFCEGEEFVLNAGNPALNHEWNTGENTQQITVDESDTYSVIVDNGYCFAEDEVVIIFNPLPDHTLLPDTSLCFNDPPYSLFLNAGNQGSLFEWSTGESSQGININNGGLYTVTITNGFNCTITDSIFVFNTCVGDFIYVPNAFTPDADGLNDVFQAKGENITDFEMMIFNRWGEKIFESADINKAWIGNDNNGQYYVESDVFVYVIKYKYIRDIYGTISDWEQIRGHVTLIR
jgi:gliding motility-associated-like protein